MKRYNKTIQTKVSNEIFESFEAIAKGFKSSRSKIIREALEVWIAYQQKRLAEQEYLNDPSLMMNE